MQRSEHPPPAMSRNAPKKHNQTKTRRRGQTPNPANTNDNARSTKKMKIIPGGGGGEKEQQYDKTRSGCPGRKRHSVTTLRKATYDCLWGRCFVWPAPLLLTVAKGFGRRKNTKFRWSGLGKVKEGGNGDGPWTKFSHQRMWGGGRGDGYEVGRARAARYLGSSRAGGNLDEQQSGRRRVENHLFPTI